jgi:exopolyphosphatase/guanosine-5'-triphosphate,3'-diphosphate pyrophosphatase
MTHELIAAVDLGSNSFRLIIGRVEGDQIFAQDNLKEAVRLAAGLTPERTLGQVAQARGLVALRKFGERLRGFEPGQVRAVATNTLRVARNAGDFIAHAERALGFPIEVVAGREEARLIYLGVVQALSDPSSQQLVFDIGGGSTEFVIGRGFEPIALESLYMGCVSYSLRFFPDGFVDKQSLREAELAAQRELDTITSTYRRLGWDLAFASSGTAKAITDILELNGYSAGGITRAGMNKLRQALLRAGNVSRLDLAGIRSDRLPVLAGGFAILSAIMTALNLDEINFSETALREGVLHDLLGRHAHRDLRDATVESFMRRYQVDMGQAERVAETAGALFAQARPGAEDGKRFLGWAARLHELGMSVARSGYHRHSTYILANADMPGFSRQEQNRLASLVLGHRGKLERVRQQFALAEDDWLLILCLRLAVILHRSRDEGEVVPLALTAERGGFIVEVGRNSLRDRPLTAALLEEEEAQWEAIAISLQLKVEGALALEE